MSDSAQPQPQPQPVPPLQGYSPAPPASGLLGKPGFYVGVIVALVIVVVLWQCSSGPGGGSQKALRLSAEVPDTCVSVVGLDSPEDIFKDLVKALEDAADEDDDLAEAIDDAKDKIEDVLGLDVTDLSEVEKAGFDLSEPITFALLEMDKERRYGPEPKGGVFSCGVTDEEAVLETIEDWVEEAGGKVKEDDDDDPVVFILDANEAVLAVSDGRLYLAVGNRGIKPDLLRDFLEEAKDEPLSETEEFRATMDGLGTGGMLSAYVALQEIFEALPKHDRVPLLDDLLGAAVAANEGEATVYLQLDSKSDALDALEPGGSCRKFLAKMDPPIAAFTWSVAEPIELVRYFFEGIDEEDDLERLDRELDENLGVDLDEVGEQLKGGCGGVVLYPSKEQNDPVSVLVFLRVNDPDEARDALEGLEDKGEFKGKEYDDNIVYIEDESTPDVAMGVIDDYFVAGNAIREIKDLAEGDADGWEPTIGGGRLAEGEVLLAELYEMLTDSREFRALFQNMDDDAKDELEETLEKIGRVTAVVEREGDGLRGVIQAKELPPLAESLTKLVQEALGKRAAFAPFLYHLF